MNAIYDVIVIGAGPAGTTAALYTSREEFSTLIIEKDKFGGELVERDLIEDYPGYPEGVLGPELGSNMVKQAQNYGTEIQFDEVKGIVIEKDYRVVKTSQGEYGCKALIIANGAHPKRLGVPGELEFINKGIFSCSTCDGPLFAGKVVAVVGGGDSGITEALFLSKLVAKVVIVELLPQMTATKILVGRVKANPKIETKCGIKIKAIRGDNQVKAIDFIDVQSGQEGILEVDGITVWVGLEANTNYLKSTVPLDERGQILVNSELETKVPGIFAAGDIRYNSPMQITTAVGDGATAALSAMRYLRNRT